MLEIKSESSERRLFARKGEAVSTAAFKAGIVPGETRQAFGHNGSSHDGSSHDGSSHGGSSMSGLSSLIQRRGSAAVAVAMGRKPEPFQPVERKLHQVKGRLVPLETGDQQAAREPAAPKRAPVVLPMVSLSPPRRKAAQGSAHMEPKPQASEHKAQAPKARPAPEPEAHERHQFTVRLRDHDFLRFMEIAVRSGRTYQDIIESAVRFYVKGHGMKEGVRTPVMPHGSPCSLMS